MRLEVKLIENFVFGRFELNSSVFEKLLISYSCISFIKVCVLRSFCIKMLYFSKIWFFQIFDWLTLSLDRLKLKNFQFLSFWQKKIFMHHLCLGFTCSALFSVSILQFCNHISHCFHTYHASTLLNWVLNLISKLID